MDRFVKKPDGVYDGGVKLRPGELEAYLRRQELAIRRNMGKGPAGDAANKLLLDEYNQALKVYQDDTLSPEKLTK